jgi:hypothetical protein
MDHREKVIVDEESRKIVLACSCGWRQNLGLVAGASATYADANAWASHLDFDARTAPYS